MPNNAVIIVAGGSGKRFGSKVPKQFLMLAGLPVFIRSVLAYKRTNLFSKIVLVAPAGRLKQLAGFSKQYGFDLVAGGKERSDSVRNGLKALPADIAIVAIHDAARPLITKDVIVRAMESAAKYGAAVASVPARDTVKLANGGKVLKTIPRTAVWLAQTPQVFKKAVIDKAYKKLGRAKVTDDAQAAEKAGYRVYVTLGDYDNIKITDKRDFDIALNLISNKQSLISNK